MVITDKINTAAKKDILELEKKIAEFGKGIIPEDKFKHFRLTRGVYGQRQTGVQMIRIKLPFGKITAAQLRKITDVSDKYSTGNLHLTTRQDIQLHYVKLNDSPQLWAELEQENITLREACGNTVRNVTASATAGIDKEEPFDVSPYAHAFAQYFLRNPVTQDMGRKIKVAFSSSEKDSAHTYFHDLGFIPEIKTENGKLIRGFKVLIGGGLGAQAITAQTAYEFLEEDKVIPFSEAVLRVFDRYGERTKRFKARLKFLIQEIGLDEFLNLTQKEQKALKNKTYKINTSNTESPLIEKPISEELPSAIQKYENWLRSNMFEQKQTGYYGVYIKVTLGDIHSSIARKLADIVTQLAADDIRVTINQGLLLRFVRKENLPALFNSLDKIGLANPGFDSTHDITTCPGSDTCNLAVTNSTELALALENVLKEEYPELIHESNIKIKISGCMNSCGQHMAAQIGFHGSSIKNGTLVAPAMQVVLGGGIAPDGSHTIAEKIVKLPTKRIPEALRLLLNDYESNSKNGEYFNDYFYRSGKNYFYQLLKPLAELKDALPEIFIDWKSQEAYKPEIGVGECAGISLDVIGTVIKEAEEKTEAALEGLKEGIWADSVYNSYSGFVIGAKALLLSVDVQCNTQAGIIRDFDKHFVQTGKIRYKKSFEKIVLQINQNEPSREFAESYWAEASLFLQTIKKEREKQIAEDETFKEKLVIDNYYKA
jgi:sulfite reductase (ferredoxin)